MNAPPPQASVVGQDFRTPAVYESWRLIRERGYAPRYSELEHSLCVTAPNSSPLALKVVCVLRLAAVLVIVLAILITMTQIKEHLVSLGVFAFCGIIMFIPGLREFWIYSFLNYKLADRARNLPEDYKQLPRYMVTVENLATFKQAKVVVEDMGYCYLDAPRHRIYIEGLTHSYVIRAEDFAGFGDLGSMSGPSIALQYMVGQASLAISVSRSASLKSSVSVWGIGNASESFLNRVVNTLRGMR